MPVESERTSSPASPLDLFLTFTSVALQGFGGVLAVAQRVLCEEKGWLTRAQFVELLTMGQVLPGPSVCNVALMMGDRAFGRRGALAALAGLMAVPFVLVLVLTELYARFAAHPAVAGALQGMAAVSAGLMIGTALKLVESLRQNVMGLPACVALGVATFALVALLQLPLVWVVLGLGFLGCAFAWRRLHAGGGQPR